MRDEVVKLLRDMAEAMRRMGDRTRVAAYARAADAIEKQENFDALYARLQGAAAEASAG